jgi:hypothetical protein
MTASAIQWRAPRRTISQPPFEEDAKKVLERLSHAPAELRQGITAGLVGGPWVGGLPRYIWLRTGAAVVEFRLEDPEQARYIRYELHPSEWPEGIA